MSANDLPVYGEVTGRPVRPSHRRPISRRQSLVGSAVAFGLVAPVVALAASTPSPPSNAPYYLASKLPDGWTLDYLIRPGAPSPITEVQEMRRSTRTYVHVDAEGFYDRVVSVISYESATSSTDSVEISHNGESLAAIVDAGECSGTITEEGLDRDELEAIANTAQCRREDDRWRIVVTLPFKATRIEVAPRTPDTTLTAIYRRGDTDRLRVASIPRGDRDLLLLEAARVDHRHRERSGYGYIRVVSSDGAWPNCGLPTVNSAAWRYDGNRIVIVSGDIDEASAVNILATVRRVSARTWRVETDPVKDAPQSAPRDPCPPSAGPS